MTVLAVVVLVMWFAYSVVFLDWKRSVDYPAKPISLEALGFATELCVIALAIWELV